MQRTITREYNYSDVYLVPNKCVVNSRSECDTSVILGGRKFDVPVIPANMPAVVNEGTCEYLAKKNIFYVMHRFDHDQVTFLRRMKDQGLCTSISIGVNPESKEQIINIKNEKLYPEYITIDIAHAWSEKTRIMIDIVKSTFPNTFLIVGNMATKEAVQEIEEWGADCCRIGVGPGKSCLTKVMTGFTRPMISCVLDCVSVATKPVIADGGIREIGDINKALACGATMVMAGSLFCGYDQSGSEIVEIDGHKKSIYFGNASQHAKKGKRVHVEGKKVIMDYMGDMGEFLIELKQSIQSGVSYAGGKDLSAFLNTRFVAIN